MAEEKEKGASPEEMRAKRARRMRTWSRPALAVVLACAVGTTGMFAYFTDEDEAVNKFTLATDDLGVVVEEPGWDALPDDDGDGVPDAAQDMVPTQWVTKDPKVTNTGESAVDAYIMATVSVPVADVTYVDEEGEKVEGKNVELFTYEFLGGDWSEVGQPVVKDGYAVHTYSWGKVLATGESTTAIFDKVSLINLVNDQGQAGAKQIVVTAIAIQQEGFDSAEDAWAAYEGQKAALAAGGEVAQP